MHIWMRDVFRMANKDDASDVDPYVGGEEVPDDETSEPTAEDRGDLLDDSDDGSGSMEDRVKVSDTSGDAGDSPSGDDSASDGDNSGDADEGEGDDSADGGEDGDSGEPAPESSDEKRGPKKGQMIPKNRFDEVNERMKRAERELEEYRKQLEETRKASEPGFDFDAKEKDYMEAVLDGDNEKALAIRREIRAAERAEFEATTAKVEESSVARVRAQAAFDETVATLEANVPELNPDNERFNEALVKEIVDLQHGILQSGAKLTAAEALMKAAKYVVGDAAEYGVEEAPETPPPATKAKQEEKRKREVKRNVDVAKGQPNKLDAGDNGTFAGDGTLNIDTMSEAEFDALPESKKRELRGDVI